jgi:hypothetical protein
MLAVWVFNRVQVVLAVHGQPCAFEVPYGANSGGVHQSRSWDVHVPKQNRDSDSS